MYKTFSLIKFYLSLLSHCVELPQSSKYGKQFKSCSKNLFSWKFRFLRLDFKNLKIFLILKRRNCSEFQLLSKNFGHIESLLLIIDTIDNRLMLNCSKNFQIHRKLFSGDNFHKLSQPSIYLDVFSTSGLSIPIDFLWNSRDS